MNRKYSSNKPAVATKAFFSGISMEAAAVIPAMIAVAIITTTMPRSSMIMFLILADNYCFTPHQLLRTSIPISIYTFSSLYELVKMSVIESIVKAFPQIFANPVLIYVLIGGLALVVFYFYQKREGIMDMKIWYFATVERLVTPLKVKKLTPKSIITKDDKTFLRRSHSWLYKEGSKNTVMFLGKVGKGLTYRLEQNKKDNDGKAIIEQIGNLYEGIKLCLGLEEDDILEPKNINTDALTKLKASKILVCVNLEDDPEGFENVTEEGAFNEANKNMADLIGLKIKQHLAREDWIRNAGLIGIGMAAVFAAQALGVL